MTLFDVVFSGNDAVYDITEKAVNAAITRYGTDQAVYFPYTTYSLPCYFGVIGKKINTLGEMKEALEVVKSLQTRKKRLDDVFMSGVATALCAEFIEVLKYIDGETPYDEPYYGHFGDSKVRKLCDLLVSGYIPGIAVIIGAAPTAKKGVALVKSYQEQGLLVTLVGDIIDQCEEKGFKTGVHEGVIPLGKDLTSVIHAISVAIRAALTYGDVKPGDTDALMEFTFDHIAAFVNVFGPLDNVSVACGAGAVALGLPIITNDVETLEAVNGKVPMSIIGQADISKMNATSLAACNIKPVKRNSNLKEKILSTVGKKRHRIML